MGLGIAYRLLLGPSGRFKGKLGAWLREVVMALIRILLSSADRSDCCMKPYSLVR